MADKGKLSRYTDLSNMTTLEEDRVQGAWRGRILRLFLPLIQNTLRRAEGPPSPPPFHT